VRASHLMKLPRHPTEAGFDNLLNRRGGRITFQLPGELREGDSKEPSVHKRLSQSRRLYQEHSAQWSSAGLQHALETYQSVLRYDPGNKKLTTRAPSCSQGRLQGVTDTFAACGRA
jgi:hypothetical protein